MSKNPTEIKLIDVIMNYNDSEEAQINFFDSPFGGTNLHLPDGEALVCHVRHDALAS